MEEREKQLRASLEGAKNIVVKVGTRVLTSGDQLDHHRMASLVQQLDGLMKPGRRVSLVSSGAVGTAMSLMKSQRPTSLGDLQAFAAIGQAELIHHYNREFEKYGRIAAQVLLTTEDINHRQRYLNLRNTFFSLFDWKAIPIVNENDCVATDEIAVTFGDNDRLAAAVAMLVDADLLIILSDVDSLYDRSPDDPNARRISFLESVDERAVSYSQTPPSTLTNGLDSPTPNLSRGGMSSKLSAARLATSAGIPALIAGGRTDGILERLVQGEPEGTLVAPGKQNVNSWKRWLISSNAPQGVLTIDDGAVAAIRERGKSLLPIGVVSVTGQFEKGDLIEVNGPTGDRVAHGISNFSTEQAQLLTGRRVADFIDELGQVTNKEIIHRNNLVLF